MGILYTAYTVSIYFEYKLCLKVENLRKCRIINKLSNMQLQLNDRKVKSLIFQGNCLSWVGEGYLFPWYINDMQVRVTLIVIFTRVPLEKLHYLQIV